MRTHCIQEDNSSGRKKSAEWVQGSMAGGHFNYTPHAVAVVGGVGVGVGVGVVVCPALFRRPASQAVTH